MKQVLVLSVGTVMVTAMLLSIFNPHNVTVHEKTTDKTPAQITASLS